ncbi:SlyX family protein [Bisbaumannia pacifica]|uniref:SlyX family protein n=1 Tax=Bisbaumannia pacifica TaxID=77098 RepID=A0ABD4L2C5_9GAMM|nr:SlyX family protein [Halomonas pacifica]MBH8579591.1 SlyX family protein [Halomonas pacifica]
MHDETDPSDSSTPNPAPLARLEARLEALESRIAYQEHWLETLDGAVADKERRLDQLERLSQLMQARLREQHRAFQEQEGGGYSPEDEVPPHY